MLGLIGESIAHTWSPRIHNAAAKEFGINHVYLPIDIESGRVKDFLDIAWDIGAVGFNVTVPHKELVASIVSGHPFQSINTIYRGKDSWQATTTDGPGFAAGFARIGQEFSDFDHIVFLGAGGVVTAIGEYMKLHSQSVRVDVLRRNSIRDRALDGIFCEVAFHSFEVDSLKKCVESSSKKTLIVQASSAPLHGDSLSQLCPALDSFEGTFCDLIYGQPSQLYFYASARDIKSLDGEAMLIEQARLAQRHWWGKSAPYETLLRAIHGK
jgi:shikimate dehydrogenase